MRQVTDFLEVETSGPGLYPITDRLARWLDGRAKAGLMTLLCQHTSASLTIQENADPDVCLDLVNWMGKAAPRGGAERYRHYSEGPDDMAAHICTVISGVHLAIPVIESRLALGTWQGVYLWEHRDRPHRRRIALHFLAD
ncbi:MAG: secondary thiamine-phosphate synthase enzyme YjbQ [Pseudomonadota bacterium]